MLPVMIKVYRIFNVITIQKLKEMFGEGLVEFQGIVLKTQFQLIFSSILSGTQVLAALWKPSTRPVGDPPPQHRAQ